MNELPKYLQNTVLAGLQRLLLLRLPGMPASDTVEGVHRAWCDALGTWGITWRADRDASRLADAFRQMSGAVDRWPSPAVLRRYLPAVEPQVALPPPRDYRMPDSWRKLVDKMTGRRAKPDIDAERENLIRDYSGDGMQP